MRLLAALAVVMHLCWPFMGQVRAADQQAVQQICTVHGLMTVPAPPDDSRSSPAKPVCALCAAAGVALNAVGSLAASPTDVPERAEHFAAPSEPQRAHHSPSRPRAPPSHA